MNHHNSVDAPGRESHQKKVSTSGGSSKGQRSGSGKKDTKQQQQTNSSSGSTVNEDEKDSGPVSNRYKNYAGISAKSVKCYWEQSNNFESECHEDVYQRVAEDVTYKLWELGNALKVYSRHTGGRVTTDLVNVVLKDMNVAPVLGANSSNWDTIDYDGCCYFNSDRVVDLREEYLKEYQMLQPGPTSITSTWVVEDEISEDLLDLFDKLCDAIFLGDEETFVAALEIADSHPFVCGIISLLLNKCTEMMAFDYKKGTLERTMKLLIALTGNSYLDQNHVNLELYYLSQLMINLVLGADNDKYFEAQVPKLANGEADMFGATAGGTGDVQQTFNEIVGNLMEYTGAPNAETVMIKAAVGGGEEEHQQMEIKKEMDLEGDPHHQQQQSNEPSIVAAEPSLFNGIENGGELKHDYEALFIMMENGEFGMKKLDEAQFQIKTEPMPEFAGVAGGTTGSGSSTHFVTELKQATEVVAGGCEEESQADELEGDESDDEATGEDGEVEEMCVITTKMCDTEDVALVCQCMGRLAGFWSYMYRECSYLLLKRVEQFFLSGVILLKCEYEWLVRAIQAVFALGEIPFREFSSYVDKLHVTITPDWVTVQLNCCGVFLRDQQDGELYELLYELCGDALLPFMLYRFMILRHFAEVNVRSRVIKYRIVSKVVPKHLRWSRNDRLNGGREENGQSTLDSWFVERTTHKVRTGKSPRIGFKFAGCRPIALKRDRLLGKEEIKVEALHGTTMDRSRIVVASRKLLRPLTNVKSLSRVYDLSSIHF